MDAIQQAAEHHSTLNAFAAVVLILEGGTVYDPKAEATAEKIIRLCNAEQQRQLKRFDAAVRAARTRVQKGGAR